MPKKILEDHAIDATTVTIESKYGNYKLNRAGAHAST